MSISGFTSFFNEDEAIFFKGRDEHIEQIVKQLEDKKFLMLTGASGDGKSSLVYAGVIPNARAGFFKAKFNNWVVADFRPEREPLTNMANTINEQLKINDVKKVEKELSYGFSSLIDLYKSSSFWVDQQSEYFTKLPADEQKKAKRKGANLLILVDQFEEFFTNPENYIHGKTSLESQTVVNILLETSRLAIEQDIPIYIVCTMRSDYIGQCASFRGLPEYIGYSQFFVPRLKRKEIYQVIEEPALLNGNKISKRLVEMLLNEMNDGIDQLPVLQHALNQIWMKADKGRVEMDLIHFAKINGIPRDHLTNQDKEEFDKWFDALPEFKKGFFDKSSLGDVLDAHANELYQTANAGIEGMVSTADAKLIVKTTFKCLTKIDESRAVRNRMTLEEVTQIINQPHITVKIVSHILYAFRMQGNTFIKPFILDEQSNRDLTDHSVLDITHESLIRNWQKLSYWAKQEHDHYLIWQDFSKQLQRWVDNEKSSGYLLPIGPLTFFETWFNKIKINKYWLARYDDREISKEQKLEEAEVIIENTKQFLKRSARRLFFSRTVLKYGADNLLAVFGLALLLISCTYFYFDFRKKQNDYVVKDLQEKAIELLKSKYVKSNIKAEYLLVAERLNPDSYKDLLKQIDGDSTQIEVVREMFANCVNYQESKKDDELDNPLVIPLFMEQLELIETKKIFQNNVSFTRNINNILGVIYGKALIDKNKIKYVDNLKYHNFCNNFYNSFIKLIEDTSSLKKIEADNFNKVLQAVQHTVQYDSLKISSIIALMNPFEKKSKVLFDLIYPKDKTVKQDWNNTLSHNGGYYQLANLFAFSNDFKNLNRCFDSIMIHNKNFLNTTWGYSYLRLLNDLTITGKLFSENGHAFIEKINKKLTVKVNFPITMIMLNNLLYDKADIAMWDLRNFAKSNRYKGYTLQLQWEKISYPELNKLADNIIQAFLSNKTITENEKNYMAALLYKSKAFANDKKENFNPYEINTNLVKALAHYNKIEKSYTKADINIGEANELKTVSRSKIFKFPFFVSLTDGSSTFDMYFWQTRTYKNKSIFLDFILKEVGLSYYFENNEDVENLNNFLLKYYNLYDFNNDNQNVMLLKPFEEALKKQTLAKRIDKDALLAFLTSYYHSIKSEKIAAFYCNQINKKEFLQKEKINKEVNSDAYYKLAKSVLNFYLEQPFIPIEYNQDGLSSKSNTGYFDSAFNLLKKFPDAFQKRNALLINIDSLQRGKKEIMTILLLDTLINANIAKTPKFGNKIFEILGRLSTTKGDEIAMKLLKDKNDNLKAACLNFFISGKAQSDKYYQATTFIPDYVSSSTQLSLYSTILKTELTKISLNKKQAWPNGISSDEEWLYNAYERDGTGFYYTQEE